MRSFVLAAFAVALVVSVCGCPQTAPPTKVSEEKLIERYKEDGDHKVTILYFKNSRCPIEMERIFEGVANLSDGSVKLKVVDGDVDREGKASYNIKTYPTALFFDAAGDLKERHGPGMSMAEAKAIARKYGATIRTVEGEEPEEPETPKEPGKGGAGEGESGEGG